MNIVILAKNNTNQYDKLPKSWAFFALSGEDGYLLAGYTAYLKQRLQSLHAKATDDPVVQAMLDKATQLHWQAHPRAMDALIHYKCFLVEQHPEYQASLPPHASYAYLALDAYTFPFVTTTDSTQGDWLYVGPFRSRFFLADVMDTFARILKLPACDSNMRPCAKYDTGACRGWCLQLDKEEPGVDAPPLEKLETLLKETFIHPENGIREMIQAERDKYFNDLEFTKASLLDEELELLDKYRDWLKFLYVAKTLEHRQPDLEIKNGRIVSCTHNGRSYHFPVDNTPYRKNESLALDLNFVDESRIIYDYLLTREK